MQDGAVPLPDARQLTEGLVGRTIRTLTRGHPNEVLRVEGSNVYVGTEKSPDGKDVALRHIQTGLDILATEGRVRITPKTFGGYRRSSFIGAVLGTLPGVHLTLPPVWVELAPGDDAFEADAPLPPLPGYPDPGTSAAIDAGGVQIALTAIRERFEGFEVELMPHDNPGFDIRVRDDEGVAVAYIEIKSTAGDEPVFYLSERERRFAKQVADRYHLLVVTNVDPAAGTGDVRWHEGALEGDDVELEPRQWHGRLR